MNGLEVLEVHRLTKANADLDAKLKQHKRAFASLEEAFAAARAQVSAPTNISASFTLAADARQPSVTASGPSSSQTAPLLPPAAAGGSKGGGAGARPSAAAASSGCCGPPSGGSKLSKVHPEP